MDKSKTPKRRKPVKKDKRKKKRKTKTPKVSVRQVQKQDVRQAVKVVVEAPKPKPRKRRTLQPTFSSIQAQQQRPQLTQIINERQALTNDFQDVLNIRLAAQERGLNQISNNLGDLERRLNPNINVQYLTPPNAVPIGEPVTAEPIPQQEADIQIETPSGFVPLDEMFARQKQQGFMDEFDEQERKEQEEEKRPDLFSGSRPNKRAEALYREIRRGLRDARDKDFKKRLMDHEEMKEQEPQPPPEPEPEPMPEPQEEKQAEIKIKGKLKLSERNMQGQKQANFEDMLNFLKKNDIKVDKRRKNDIPSNRKALEKQMIQTLGINASGAFSEERIY